MNKKQFDLLGFEVEKLSQDKLKKLRKLTSKLIKQRVKNNHKTKYGNINKGFTDEELKRFLSSCKHSKAYLTFFLMSHLGLRVSEAISIKTEDIDWTNNKIRISTLKANTGDFQFMPKQVRILLLTWVRKHAKEIEEHNGFVLFSSNPKEKRDAISPGWLRNEFRDVCRLCNLDEWYDYAEDEKNNHIKNNRKLHRLTTHSLRHYFITKCYNNCKNPIMTQKLARHTNFRSTQVYIHIDYEKMGKLVEDIFEPENTTEKAEAMEFVEMYARFKEMKKS